MSNKYLFKDIKMIFQFLPLHITGPTHINQFHFNIALIKDISFVKKWEN